METSASLLERLTTRPDEAAWQRLDRLYRPLIRHWLLREARLRDDVDDLVQEVMAVLVRELPGFHRRRTGSFRRWLRTVTAHRLQAFLRDRRNRPGGRGEATDEYPLVQQLADPHSELSRQWDREHNAHVVRRLLELIEDEFAPGTLRAFRRLVFDERRASEVAAELGMTVNAVLVAKSKVLNRLRQEADGFLD